MYADVIWGLKVYNMFLRQSIWSTNKILKEIAVNRMWKCEHFLSSLAYSLLFCQYTVVYSAVADPGGPNRPPPPPPFAAFLGGLLFYSSIFLLFTPEVGLVGGWYPHPDHNVYVAKDFRKNKCRSPKILTPKRCPFLTKSVIFKVKHAPSLLRKRTDFFNILSINVLFFFHFGAQL